MAPIYVKVVIPTLFTSASKFDSGCGWPSFDASEEGKIIYSKDTSHRMMQTEIVCANCRGHLGHIFDDGPTEQDNNIVLTHLV